MRAEQQSGGFAPNLDQIRQFQARRFTMAISGMPGQIDGASHPIQTIFEKKHTLHVVTSFVEKGQSPVQQAELLKKPSMLALAEAMSETPDDFRFQLGLILAQVPYDQLSDRLKSNLSIQHEARPLSVQPYHPKYNWSLCAEGDEMMDKSLKTGQAFVINDNLVMKGISRPSVLCINSFATDQGTCLAGGWYAFENEAEVIEKLRGIPRTGQKQVEITSGSLVYLKDLPGDENGTRDERLKAARDFALKAADIVNPWYWRPNPFPTLPVV